MMIEIIVTQFGKTWVNIYFIEEAILRKTVTLSGGWRFTDTRSRMGITTVRTNTDDNLSP